MNTIVKEIIDNYNPSTFNADNIIKQLRNKYPNLGTLSKNLSIIKSKLSKSLPNNPEFNKLKLTNDEYSLLNKKSQNSLNHKLDSLLVIKNSKVFLNEILQGLSNSNKYDELFPALLLATGRRSIEILKTGKFKTIKNKIYFYGQAKKRNEKSKGYVIPLLYDTKTIQKSLLRLRKGIACLTDGLNNDEIHDTFKRRNYNIFQKLSEKYQVNLTPHSFRSIYAEFCNIKFNKDKSNAKYRAEILGHSDNNSQLHYSSVRLE